MIFWRFRTVREISSVLSSSLVSNDIQRVTHRTPFRFLFLFYLAFDLSSNTFSGSLASELGQLSCWNISVQDNPSILGTVPIRAGQSIHSWDRSFQLARWLPSISIAPAPCVVVPVAVTSP